VPAEQAAIAAIRKLRAEGKWYRAIADALAGMGFTLSQVSVSKILNRSVGNAAAPVARAKPGRVAGRAPQRSRW
jgi:hypothetical protein